MQSHFNNRLSAEHHQALLREAERVTRQAWNRFGAHLFASIAALTLSVATIGSVSLMPIEPAGAVQASASASEQTAPDAAPSYPMLRGPML